jgi:bifunctional non-homologous end joining protein LigD
MQFIVPAQPKLRASPPLGDDWTHEIKFDGWRVQVHKYGREVRLYTKSGFDCTTRFAGLAKALKKVPAPICIIDGEVVASDR